jgi:LmbE family N-acetylglucosaminyl deacetylase
MTHQLYLSPHLDDAVLSCGGLIARQAARGDLVAVFSVCAGDPPVGELTPFAFELHRRWGGEGSPIAARRAEDRVACGRLGASAHHYHLPDAIYRRDAKGQALYSDEQAIFQQLRPEDQHWVDMISEALRGAAPPEASIYCPLGIGGHVDHRLARLAAEAIGRPLTYYRELPYAARQGELPSDLSLPAGQKALVDLIPEEIQAWASAIMEYRSQLTTFWPETVTPEVIMDEIGGYLEELGGLPLISVV